MSLSFTGPRGTVEQRWIVYALLRDNVQHHLENGEPGAEFGAIHEAAGALGGNRVVLDARQLRAELEKAATLLSRPIAELAISPRTRAVIDRSWPPPAGQETRTVLAKGNVTLAWLSPAAATLDGVFGNLVRSLLEITDGAAESDRVEVDDT